MKTLKKIISGYMYKVAMVLVIIILLTVLFIQFTNERKRTYENAIRTLLQIEQVLTENQNELVEIQNEYRQTCLHNAEAIAHIIESNPDVLNDVEELKKIAVFMEVDEIHIFDKSGRIFTGTHPQYYNFTFDSGEQMMFFKPMLEDKSLKLVQDITPNTAENKLMQYSALWSNNGEFIVQVGMEPVNVTKVTEKNEMSYIFSLFRVNPEANYYAIDSESGKIVGSTDLENIGMHLTDIGFKFNDIAGDKVNFYAKINGQNSFCVFKKIGNNYVGQVVSIQCLYQRLPAIILTLFICLMIMAFVLINAVTKHMTRHVVNKIHDINDKLNSISSGNLDENIDVHSSLEFSELSNYINRMVNSLLNNSKKMSYVLGKTNLYIGIYEYNNTMNRVRFSKYIPQIFSLDSDIMQKLSLDINRFKAFINDVHKNPIPDDHEVYKVGEKYVKLGEIVNNDDVFGVAVDVTAEIMKRREIEIERDIDSLTGLYNRRGIDRILDELFTEPDKLGYSAIIMVDSDGLKMINDTYGHESGDTYIKKIAEILSNFGEKNSIVARQGGDEFVLFLHNYNSEYELIKTIKKLELLQNSSYMYIEGKERIPIRFSFGYSLIGEDADYQNLLRTADKKMYKNKLSRKEHDA